MGSLMIQEFTWCKTPILFSNSLYLLFRLFSLFPCLDAFSELKRWNYYTFTMCDGQILKIIRYRSVSRVMEWMNVWSANLGIRRKTTSQSLVISNFKKWERIRMKNFNSLNRLFDWKSRNEIQSNYQEQELFPSTLLDNVSVKIWFSIFCLSNLAYYKI